MQFAVSGFDSGMLCIPLPRRSLWWQSSNWHQKMSLLLLLATGCGLMAQGDCGGTRAGAS